MALLKTLEILPNIDADYWRVWQVISVYDADNAFNQIIVAPHYDAQSREAGDPQLPQTLSFDVPTVQFSAGMTRQEAYAYLKTTPTFRGALDV